ncbi:MAG: glutathione S-transferase family protein [Gammaproteobacteria bacterium]|nr:MAG: glutathione S-transferase family protein [Gammaproteobacteria bacterium]
MADIILHHYPQSPVAEKVRVVLGMKNASWRSVQIPRLPPKPELMPLTGGYRRTPVLQAGADIYCDSQCIIRELERRYPQPTLYPHGAAGLPWAVSRWTDGSLFNLVVGAVMGAQADELPEDFANDRGRLYFGPDFDWQAQKKLLPHTLAQIRAQLGWIDQRLSGERDFILGSEPGLPDALCYHLVWFFRGRYAGGPALLGQFPNLTAWEERVAAIGHGHPEDMDAKQALEIARSATPESAGQTDPDDPQGLAPGQMVAVVPDVDGGDPSVEGRVVGVSVDVIAISRSAPEVGNIVVHFPRVGYRVTRLE